MLQLLPISTTIKVFLCKILQNMASIWSRNQYLLLQFSDITLFYYITCCVWSILAIFIWTRSAFSHTSSFALCGLCSRIITTTNRIVCGLIIHNIVVAFMPFYLRFNILRMRRQQSHTRWTYKIVELNICIYVISLYALTP